LLPQSVDLSSSSSYVLTSGVNSAMTWTNALTLNSVSASTMSARSIALNSTVIAIGSLVGSTLQNNFSVAIGANAGQSSQGTSSIAIGLEAGQITHGANAIAIGTDAGNSNQLANAVAIGVNAGTQLFQSLIHLTIDRSVDVKGNSLITANGTVNYEAGMVGANSAQFLNTAGGTATNYLRGSWEGAPEYMVSFWFYLEAVGAKQILWSADNDTTAVYHRRDGSYWSHR
jgi:hypothetical protein